MSDRFFQVPRTTFRTSEGLVDLPIRYFDGTAVFAFFEVPRERAVALLAGTGLSPGLGSRAHAPVALAYFDYRSTSVGAYHEVGLSILAVRAGERAPRLGLADLLLPPRRRRLGAWVVDLPVTTAAANAAGREIWGYPKFVTSIPFRRDGRSFACSVLDPDGATILEHAGELGRGAPVPALSLLTYTRLDDALIRTPIDVRGLMTVHAPGSTRLSIGSSRHPMAEHLRALALEGARPKLILATNRFQSLLHAGTQV